MKVVGESVGESVEAGQIILDSGPVYIGTGDGAVDAAFHNNSIYIAEDAGYYWIAGPETIEKKKTR